MNSSAKLVKKFDINENIGIKFKEIFRLLTYCKQNDRECKNQNHLTHNKLWFVTEVLLALLRKGLKGIKGSERD